MQHTAKMMHITIKDDPSGVFFATSEDEPTFFVSAVDAEDLWSAIGLAIEDMYLCRHNIVAKAIPMEGTDYAHRPWAVVPIELIAQISHNPAEKSAA